MPDSTPDNKRVALRNADGVLVHQVIELAGHTPEVEVLHTLAHTVLPNLLQGWGYWGHISARCQKALKSSTSDSSLAALIGVSHGVSSGTNIDTLVHIVFLDTLQGWGC